MDHSDLPSVPTQVKISQISPADRNNKAERLTVDQSGSISSSDRATILDDCWIFLTELKSTDWTLDWNTRHDNWYDGHQPLSRSR